MAFSIIVLHVTVSHGDVLSVIEGKFRCDTSLPGKVVINKHRGSRYPVLYKRLWVCPIHVLYNHIDYSRRGRLASSK